MDSIKGPTVGKTFSPGEILVNALSRIEKQYQCQSIELDYGTHSEIAKINDGYSERIGYMRYESFIVLATAKHPWALAIGVKVGAYPGDQFRRDLIAIGLDSNMSEPAMKQAFRMAIESGNCDYFRRSLLIGLDSGYFGASTNSIFKTEMLTEALNKTLANEAMQNAKVVTTDLQTIYNQPASYAPSAIDCIVQSVMEILASKP